MPKPIPVNAFAELQNKMKHQAVEGWKESDGNLKITAVMEVVSNYDIDKNGNISVDAGGETVIPAEVPVSASAKLSWLRKSAAGKDGVLKLTWRMEWKDD